MSFALGGVLGAVAGGDVRISWAITPASSDSSWARRIRAAIDVEEAAGQSERVDFIGIDDLDGEGNARVGVAHEILADAIERIR